MSVGKIALFAKAMVAVMACVALAMCAMWVGFLSSFFAGGRKKQNKFPSNLHCPIIKLNSFNFQFITMVSVGRLSFYTCCQRFSTICQAGDCWWKYSHEELMFNELIIRSTRDKPPACV